MALRLQFHHRRVFHMGQLEHVLQCLDRVVGFILEQPLRAQFLCRFLNQWTAIEKFHFDRHGLLGFIGIGNGLKHTRDDLAGWSDLHSGRRLVNRAARKIGAQTQRQTEDEHRKKDLHAPLHRAAALVLVQVP